MNPNVLAQWMQFYDQNMPQVPTGGPRGMYESSLASRQRNASDAFNNAGRRMMFSEQMGQEQRQPSPDFFGGMPQSQLPPYVRPAQMPQQEQPGFGGDIENFLRSLMQGRGVRSSTIGIRG